MRRKLVINPQALMLELGQTGPAFEVGEVAFLLRISKGKVHQLVRTRVLDGYKLVGCAKVLVERQSVRDYLAASRNGAGAAKLETSDASS
jgi:excisionase family DNA binding protein